jgi:hypothetical protein
VVRGVVAELGRVVESSLKLDLRWAITDSEFSTDISLRR